MRQGWGEVGGLELGLRLGGGFQQSRLKTVPDT